MLKITGNSFLICCKINYIIGLDIIIRFYTIQSNRFKLYWIIHQWIYLYIELYIKIYIYIKNGIISISELQFTGPSLSKDISNMHKEGMW